MIPGVVTHIKLVQGCGITSGPYDVCVHLMLVLCSAHTRSVRSLLPVLLLVYWVVLCFYEEPPVLKN
jgi:hypothetical protein